MPPPTVRRDRLVRLRGERGDGGGDDGDGEQKAGDCGGVGGGKEERGKERIVNGAGKGETGLMCRQAGHDDVRIRHDAKDGGWEGSSE